jgi:hypothetical protein
MLSKVQLAGEAHAYVPSIYARTMPRLLEERWLRLLEKAPPRDDDDDDDDEEEDDEEDDEPAVIREPNKHE